MNSQNTDFNDDNLCPRTGSESAGNRKKLKKALLTLRTLELMAQNIYKFQISGKRSELNGLLIAAMSTEMTHYQDFQVKLYEYGIKPSKFRWVYWLVGFAFGFGSRLLGEKAILKVGIWTESKAVRQYEHLLKSIDWDQQTKLIVEKDLADEKQHIETWRQQLSKI